MQLHFLNDFANSLDTASSVATLETSYRLLVWLQDLVGTFVGYQVALDLGLFCGAWFEQRVVVACGSGAVSDIANIFSDFPYQEQGMNESSVA